MALFHFCMASMCELNRVAPNTSTSSVDLLSRHILHPRLQEMQAEDTDYPPALRTSMGGSGSGTWKSRGGDTLGKGPWRRAPRPGRIAVPWTLSITSTGLRISYHDKQHN